MQPSSQPLISAPRIEQRIRELAAEIRARYGTEEIVLLAVLKGAIMFAADLLRELDDPIRIEFVRVRTYEGTESVRAPHIEFAGAVNLASAHVVIVDDVLDTGRTTAVLLDTVRAAQPASAALCVLLDKPSRRIEAVDAAFVGFEIGEQFVIGYGLDHDERYRNLPAVYVLEP